MTGLIPFNRKRNDVMNVGFDDFSNMLDDFFTGSWPNPRSLAGDTFKLDIQEDDKAYKIEVEVPGIKKEDIDLTMDEGRMTLSVKKEEVSDHENKRYLHRERKFSQMTRSIVLADAVDDGVEAKLEDGLLTLMVAKKEEVASSKRISID